MLLHCFVPCTVNRTASQQALHSNLNPRKLLWLNSYPKNSHPPKSSSLTTGCPTTTMTRYAGFGWDIFFIEASMRPHNLSQPNRVPQKCRNVEWKQKGAKYFLAAVSDQIYIKQPPHMLYCRLLSFSKHQKGFLRNAKQNNYAGRSSHPAKQT